MDKDSRLWILMARSLSNEATQAEKEELYTYLEANPKVQDQYISFKEIWNVKPETDASTSATGETSTKLNSIFQKAAVIRQEDGNNERPGIRKTIFKLFNWKYLSVAALLLVTLGIFISKNSSVNKNIDEQIVTAQNGSRIRVLLPDGTTVWLNSGSKLYYQHDFNGTTRNVRLEGEAFFDVKKQVNRPFIVRAGTIDIKVLGTAFNVKSYDHDKTIETTLLRGSIEVIPLNGKRVAHLLLKPNEKLILDRGRALTPDQSQANNTVPARVETYKIEKLNTQVKENERFETAWLYNRIVFKGDTFDELAPKLERWYNVDIIFEDPEVKLLKFNGSFEEETVLQAFEALQKVATFSFKIKGHEIFIKSLK